MLPFGFKASAYFRIVNVPSSQSQTSSPQMLLVAESDPVKENNVHSIHVTGEQAGLPYSGGDIVRVLVQDASILKQQQFFVDGKTSLLLWKADTLVSNSRPTCRGT
uniref:Uncharacterized protein n=1 Tax=Mycena chlorophos TaxID=658473 RepID=A0ABQ0LEK3_MYCCL|nr:predicted protein [Mycena chlorophos]